MSALRFASPLFTLSAADSADFVVSSAGLDVIWFNPIFKIRLATT